MKLLLLFILALCITITFAPTANAINKVIYGVDNRYEVHESDNPLFTQLADATATRVSVAKFSPNSEGVYKVNGATFGVQHQLCQDEKYYNQKVVGDCSGFLVAPNLLVTAGHCMMRSTDCSENVWVFGYYADANGDELDSVPLENIYACKKVLEGDLQFWGEMNDYALIQLDRPVTGREPLTVRTEGKVEDDVELVVIGNPSGLPTKIADQAYVRDNENDVYFKINSDTFGGSSGSAVMNAETGMVEGILVRGERDFTYDFWKKCYRSTRCKDTSCRGEDVTRITNMTGLMQYLKAISEE